MARNIGDLQLNISANTEQLQVSIKQIETQTDSAQRKVTSFGGGVKNMFNTLKGSVSSAAAELPIIGGLFTSLSTAITGTATATTGLTTATALFGAALTALGIGALLIVLGSLVTYFTQTQAGARQLAIGMEVLGGVTTLIVDKMAELGGKLIDFVLPAIKSVFEFFSSTEAGSGLETATANIANNIKRGYEIASAQEALYKRQTDALISQERLSQQIADAKLAAVNAESTIEDRLKAQNRAIALTNQLQDDRLSIAEEELRIKKLIDAQGNNTKEDDRETAQLEKQILEIKKQRSDALRELNERQTSLTNQIKKQKEEQLKAADAAGKTADKLAAQLTPLQKIQQTYENINSAIQDIGGVAIYNKRLDQFLVDEKGLKNLKVFRDEYSNIIASLQNELTTAFKKGLPTEQITSQLDIVKQKFDEISKNILEGELFSKRVEIDVDLNSGGLGTTNPIEEALGLSSTDLIKEKINGIEEVLKQALSAGLEPAENGTDNISKLISQLDVLKEKLEEIEAIDPFKKFLESSSNIAGGIGDLGGAFIDLAGSYAESEEAQKEFVDKARNFAIAFVLIQQGMAIAKALTTAISSSFTIWDMVGNIAAATATVVSAFAAIPKFANGGIYQGSEGFIAGEGSTPEVIMPLSRISQVQGSQSNFMDGEIVGYIKNNDIALAYKRGSKARSRQRGLKSN